MRGVYLTMLALILTGVTMAQVDTRALRGKGESPRVTKKKPAVQQVVNTLKVDLWSSDFSSPTDWTIGNSAGNNANWTISDAPSFWWSSNAPLASTSGGYAASFNSDNFATGANQIENNAWVETATAINCSGYSALAVSFQQYFNKWTGMTIVEVSVDGGNSWTDFEVNEGMSNNDETTNPSTITVNISSVAANEPAVLVRLLYLSNAISDGGTDNTAGDAWDYGWIVDDFKIGTLPDNDLALTKGWHADITGDYEYSMLTTEQSTPREMVPGVIVKNEGGMAQNVDITCEISDGSTVVSTMSVNHTSGLEAIDTVWFNTGYFPTVDGDYTVTFSIPSDMDPFDDSFTASPLNVNPFYMAHDYGATSSYGWNPQSTSQSVVDNAHAPHSWGNIYYPEVNQDIYGIDVNFAQNTTPGLYMLARVQQMDGSGSVQGQLSLITQAEYYVDAADVGNTITTIKFPNAVTLQAGQGYIIDIFKVDGTSGNEAFYIGGSDDFTEDDDFSTVCYGPYGTNNAVNYWLSWGFAPYVRANFDPSLSVQNIALEGIKIYPNPSEGIINISNDNNETSKIEVLDVTGKLILTKEANIATSIDLSTENSGIYFVKVSNSSGSLVEKLILK